MKGMETDGNINYTRYNESAINESVISMREKNEQPEFRVTQGTFAGTEFKQSQVDNDDY